MRSPTIRSMLTLVVLLVACSSPTLPSSKASSVPIREPVVTTQHFVKEATTADVGRSAAGPTCGDRKRELSEECDDGNMNNGDGCNARCRSEAVQVASNGLQTCVVTSVGGVKC